ncbi:hypothetical protein KR054_008289 [Drosophila jambulina]|nr:hypothetical protein KR054_008289 [Drosophila jambulina]
MSAAIGGRDGPRDRTWSSRSSTSVAETMQIGDGPQLRRQRPSRLNPPYRVSNRLLTVVEQRLRTSSLRRAALLRKLRLQRSLEFYSGLRSSQAGPAAVFGYHPAANVDQPVFGNWYGMGMLTSPDADEEDPGSHHWEPAQLHFQQYLGQPYHQPSRSILLSLDRSHVQLFSDLLFGWALKEALRLGLNEVFSMFHP